MDFRYSLGSKGNIWCIVLYGNFELYIAATTCNVGWKSVSSTVLSIGSDHYDFTTDKVCNSLRIQVLVDTCAMRPLALPRDTGHHFVS